MGSNSSNLTNDVLQHLNKRFYIHQHPVYTQSEHFKFLIQKLTQKAFILRVISMNDRVQKQRLQQTIFRKCAISSSQESLTPLEIYYFDMEQAYCTNLNRCITIFALPTTLTLRNCILNHRNNASILSQDYLLKGIQSLVESLCMLKHLGETHGNINTNNIYCNEQRMVLSDPWIAPQQGIDQYPAPQKIKKMRNEIEFYDSYAADLFSIGMCILEVFHDQQINKLYKKNGTFNTGLLTSEIQKCSYQKVKEQLKIILLGNEEDRIRYIYKKRKMEISQREDKLQSKQKQKQISIDLFKSIRRLGGINNNLNQSQDKNRYRRKSPSANSFKTYTFQSLQKNPSQKAAIRSRVGTNSDINETPYSPINQVLKPNINLTISPNFVAPNLLQTQTKPSKINQFNLSYLKRFNQPLAITPNSTNKSFDLPNQRALNNIPYQKNASFNFVDQRINSPPQLIQSNVFRRNSQILFQFPLKNNLLNNNAMNNNKFHSQIPFIKPNYLIQNTKIDHQINHFKLNQQMRNVKFTYDIQNKNFNPQMQNKKNNPQMNNVLSNQQMNNIRKNVYLLKKNVNTVLFNKNSEQINKIIPNLQYRTINSNQYPEQIFLPHISTFHSGRTFNPLKINNTQSNPLNQMQSILQSQIKEMHGSRQIDNIGNVNNNFIQLFNNKIYEPIQQKYPKREKIASREIKVIRTANQQSIPKFPLSHLKKEKISVKAQIQMQKNLNHINNMNYINSLNFVQSRQKIQNINYSQNMSTVKHINDKIREDLVSIETKKDSIMQSNQNQNKKNKYQDSKEISNISDVKQTRFSEFQDSYPLSDFQQCQVVKSFKNQFSQQSFPIRNSQFQQKQSRNNTQLNTPIEERCENAYIPKQQNEFYQQKKNLLQFNNYDVQFAKNGKQQCASNSVKLLQNKQYQKQQSKIVSSQFEKEVQNNDAITMSNGFETPVRVSSLEVQTRYNHTIPQEQQQEQESAEQKFLNGDLIYVQQDYEHGGRYVGFTRNGRRNGEGTYKYPEGGYYKGQWKDDMMNGFGRIYYENNLLAYEGQWYRDQFHGRGKIYNQEYTVFNVPIDYTNFQLFQSCWKTYQGDLSHDLRSGFGKMIFSNGEYYSGEFRNDKIHGKGLFRKMDGSVIRGNWVEGILKGEQQLIK